MQIQTKQTTSKTELLGNLISLEYGSGLTSSNRKGSNYPVFGSNGIVGYHDQYLIKGPGVIVGRKGSIGEVTWSDIDFWAIDTTYYVKLKNENISLKWIYYLLSQKNLRDLNSATGIPGLNRNDVYKVTCFSPSFKEQQKIASILSNVDELIQKTEQIIEQTQRLKKGLMQRLLTKGIGHTKFKKTKLGEIPDQWNIENLGNVLSICQYGLSLALSEKGAFPIFRMNNIENGYMITNDMKYIDLDQKLFEQFKLEKEDILINRTNSIDLVGKLGIFLLDGNYTFASYLIRLRTIKEKLLPFFLNLYLNSEKMQYKLKSLATAGVSQANINATNLKNLQIPIPPLSEQQKIITIILKIDNIFKKIREKDILLNLKKGLMQQLLTGKIRVKV